MVRLGTGLALALATASASATVTLTVDVSSLNGGTDPDAYITVTVENCAAPTVWNSSTIIPATQKFYPGNGVATFNLHDNVTEVACQGNFLSYYSFDLVSNGETTHIGNYELPPGRFNLANLAPLTVPPIAPGIIQGPIGPSGPAGPPGGLGGAWDNSIAYAAGSVVVYGGNTYVAMATSSNVAPGSDSTFWLLISPIRVQSYGATCNWNGTSGTDDTAAFQSAVNAAHAAYVATGAPASVSVDGSCVVNGTVTIGSGVIMTGSGMLVIQNQTGGTLLFQNADAGGVQGLTLNVTANAIGNDANISAISWRNTSSDTAAHSHWFARNNSIIGNASWGILVDAYQGGAGSTLSDVDISGNSIVSPTVGSNADGIHVAGSASNVTIRGNRVTNRGDAAIAVSSEVGVPSPQNVVVEGNVLTDNLVGLDCSGCQNTTWAHNYVNSSNSFGGASDPAARAIFYGGSEPFNVKFVGNYLVNTSTGEAAAKVDQRGGGTAPVNVEWVENTIGLRGLNLYANTVTVSGNTFQTGSTLAVLADPTITARNISVGPNYWQGSGTFRADSNPSYYVNNFLAEQVAPMGLTYTTSSANNVPVLSFMPSADGSSLVTSKPLTGTPGFPATVLADGTSGKAFVVKDTTQMKNYMQFDETQGFTFDTDGVDTRFISSSAKICTNDGLHCPVGAYTPSGTLVPGTHIVSGTAPLTGGTATVTFSGFSAYTSPTSYVCTASDVSATNAVRFTAISGTTANFVGTSGDTVSFVCAGI